MSRIKGIGILKRKKEPEIENRIEKDDEEKNQIRDLIKNIPKLGKSFEIHRKVGEGTFSTVYLGTMRQQSGLHDSEKKWFAIKHLVPTTHPTRVVHELRCLRDIGGINHVIGVELCIRNLDHVVFVMPYIPHRKFSEYVRDMDAEELRRYMRALLTALKHVHTFGVIHRDVKPSNFLYDRNNGRYALVDFGLAQHTKPMVEQTQPPPAHQSLKRPRQSDSPHPAAKRLALDLTTRARSYAPVPRPTSLPLNMNEGERLSHMSPPPAHSLPPPACEPCACAGVAGVCSVCAVWAPPRANRAGTQGFRPPEVLFKYADQSTAVDIWASGVVLASVLTGRYPFFRASDDMTAVAEIMAFTGTTKLSEAARALGRRLVTSTFLKGVCLRRLALHLRCRPAARVWPAAPGAPLSAGDCAACRLPPSNCFCLDGRYPGDEIHPTRSYAGFPDSAFALAARLLEPNPRDRITAAEALRHPFLEP